MTFLESLAFNFLSRRGYVVLLRPEDLSGLMDAVEMLTPRQDKSKPPTGGSAGKPPTHRVDVKITGIQVPPVET